MKVRTAVPLDTLNSLQVPCTADEVVIATSLSELEEVLDFDGPIAVLGAGTNVVLPRRMLGRVVLPRFMGMSINASMESPTVRAGAGEVWHRLVTETLRCGCGGLENLSLIPGLVGAAPFQNIGAYGRELSDVLLSVEAYDRQEGQHLEIMNGECGFGYRSSVFREDAFDRYVITHITLALGRHPPNIEYPGVREKIESRGWDSTSAADVANAVATLRESKLPDPDEHPNAGSFFKNPFVSKDHFAALQREEQIQGYPSENAVKVPAAHLIELAGWKGRRIGDVLVWPLQPLVLVNAGKAEGEHFLEVSSRISADVACKFGVRLELEPIVLGCAERP